MPFFDADALKAWFVREKRALPWRENPSPYAVWVSEIMLQQTQASVVIPYFRRWMEKFPSIEAVANAPLEALLKSWEGLGYYSRVRYLHEAAKSLLKDYGGELPSEPEKLATIKGIGPYTQGAILSFAFHKKAAAVDGNVLRVMARYFSIEEEISSVKKKIQELTEQILPREEPWVVMEGIIELGAQVCRKTPLCGECPLNKNCLAHLHRKSHLIPLKKKRERTTLLQRAVAIVIYEKKLLIGRVKGKKVMADLYEFPYVEISAQKHALTQIKKMIRNKLKVSSNFSSSLGPVDHTFTRYHATLFPSIWRAEESVEVADYEWKTKEEIASLPFSSGHRQILQSLTDAHFTH